MAIQAQEELEAADVQRWWQQQQNASNTCVNNQEQGPRLIGELKNVVARQKITVVMLASEPPAGSLACQYATEPTVVYPPTCPGSRP